MTYEEKVLQRAAEIAAIEYPEEYPGAVNLCMQVAMLSIRQEAHAFLDSFMLFGDPKFTHKVEETMILKGYFPSNVPEPEKK